MGGELGNVRLVIVFLGIATLIIIGGGVFLAAREQTIPDALIGLGGTSLGALGAMLSKTSTPSPPGPPSPPFPPPLPPDLGDLA